MYNINLVVSVMSLVRILLVSSIWTVVLRLCAVYGRWLLWTMQQGQQNDFMQAVTLCPVILYEFILDKLAQ